MYVYKGVLFVLTIFISLALADRKLYSEFNPGCMEDGKCKEYSRLEYIRADGDNDTVHFLFGFTQKPSLIIVTTSKDAVIDVNYTKMRGNIEDSVKFTKPPLYTFATVFHKLYEFNDVHDTARMDNNTHFMSMDFKQFKWNMSKIQNNNNESVEFSIFSSEYRGVGIQKTGTVSITLRVYGKRGQGPKYPHLIHTPESSELTLTLDQLNTSFKKSRFAVELLTLSSSPFNKSEEISVAKFPDDLSSGGTFINYVVDALGDDLEEGGGYLSWKPVVFKAPDTHALNSSSTEQYGIHNHSNENDWIQTTLYLLFGNALFNDGSRYLKKATNISFGQPGDDFYVKSNYLYWTFLVGVGAPPDSTLGFLEMSIVASLILLLTIAMILMFCVFMRWVSSKRNLIIYGQ